MKDGASARSEVGNARQRSARRSLAITSLPKKVRYRNVNFPQKSEPSPYLDVPTPCQALLSCSRSSSYVAKLLGKVVHASNIQCRGIDCRYFSLCLAKTLQCAKPQTSPATTPPKPCKRMISEVCTGLKNRRDRCLRQA